MIVETTPVTYDQEQRKRVNEILKEALAKLETEGIYIYASFNEDEKGNND
jgi:hypothetical protein